LETNLKFRGKPLVINPFGGANNIKFKNRLEAGFFMLFIFPQGY
tara:strand:- start:82 stop:213 length:132 start_codon:yes stop_codon:yes gene_type:complete